MSEKIISAIIENNKLIIDLNSLEDCITLLSCFEREPCLFVTHVKESIEKLNQLIFAKRQQYAIENDFGANI